MTSVISLQKICKSYKTKAETLRVLKGLDLEVLKGQVVGVIGASGSGKSTLLHIAGLLDNADSGDIIINGEKVEFKSNEQITKIRSQNIGFIYQFHHLLAEFTAVENAAMPLMIQGKSKKEAIERAEPLLNQFNIFKRRDHYPSEMSGGEQQRLAIARAFIINPNLIIADEPTGNLDESLAHEVFDYLLQAARNKNISCLIATHDMQLVKKMDIVYHLEQGKLTEVKVK
jgi:lipoprotein-releasing system ATP-binding protein